jgi:predicted dehydrogenase
MAKPIRILVVGCGHMGTSHAKAYHALPEFEIVGVVSRGEASRRQLLSAVGGDYRQFTDFDEALAATKPDAVSINTYPDTHADYARKAFAAGCHVFLEKPLANTVAEAREVVDLARKTGKKLVIGYVLRVHPTWTKFIETAKTLGKPLVMRMNLNQQSSADQWKTHKQLMNSMSPIVDCGVHYVDVMCLMTGSKPVRVSAIGARLTDELVPGMYNYGQLQVTFADGSVGDRDDRLDRQRRGEHRLRPADTAVLLQVLGDAGHLGTRLLALELGGFRHGVFHNLLFGR